MLERAAVDSRAEVLALLAGRRSASAERQRSGARGNRKPCFSGLVNVTAPGLDFLGLRFGEVHTDPAKMAAAAATTHRLFGFESAVVPFDLCVEAGALGAKVDFHTDVPRPAFPMVTEPIAVDPHDFYIAPDTDITGRERVVVVVEAIRLLKNKVGREIAVGAWAPGPFTLALQLIQMNALMAAVAKEPEAVGRVLDVLTDVLTGVGLAYRSAGADFLTVHEMGGSPGFIGPPAFKKIVQPRLVRLLAALPAPRVLSVCGDTNRAMPALAECGAEALSVDQTNDLARSRETLGPEALLFGNIDPVGTLAHGDEAGVRRAVRRAIDAGADAIWPGCDLWPLVPADNMRAMMDEARSYRGG